MPNQEDVEIQEVPIDRRISRILEGSKGRKNEPKYPKAGENIQVKEGGQWRQAAVIGRGAKANSKKHSDYYNIRLEGAEPSGVYLDKIVWKKGEDMMEEEVNVVIIPTSEHGRPECKHAKMKELEVFDKFDVYEEVEDIGQERLSSR